MMTIEEAKEAFREAMAKSLEAPPEPPEPEVDLEELYDAIMVLQRELRYELQAYELAIETPYRLIKALAATYELQEYLAGAIAQARADGDLEPAPE